MRVRGTLWFFVFVHYRSLFRATCHGIPFTLCCLLHIAASSRLLLNNFPAVSDIEPPVNSFRCDIFSQAPLSPSQTCYRLTGLIQHRGSRLGGHYVAYVRDKEGWKHASDSAIRTATLPELKACEVSTTLRVTRLGWHSQVVEDSGGLGLRRQ